MIRIALLATDNREHNREYDRPAPYFGTAVEALLQGFARANDVQVHILSCTQRPMASPSKIADNIWFHLLDVPKLGWLRTGYQGCIRAVRRRLNDLRPDIVHGQGTERECAISSAFSGWPNVVTIHGNLAEIAREMHPLPGSYLWCAAKLENFTIPRTGGVLCNSEYTEAVVKPRARRTWRVPNALRLAFFDSAGSASVRLSKPLLLNIGVVSPYKRQVEVLDIATKLHQEGQDFQIQFIGTANPADPYAKTFLDRIAGCGTFAQHYPARTLPELIATLDSASALIHLPSQESFGLVAAEALARNLKFFGTDVGGLRDIAKGVEGAELFSLNDSDRLRSSITQWMRSGSVRPKTAKEEMERRYHPDVITQRHVQIYTDILSSR